MPRRLIMPKTTYQYSNNNVSAVSTNYCMGIIEAGPTKKLQLQRLSLWNPGMMTTAQLTTITIYQQTTVGSGTTGTAPPRDPNNPAFSGTIRVAGATAGTLGVALGSFVVWVPAALGPFASAILDLTNEGLVQPPTIDPGLVAALAASAMAGTNYYMIASLGNTVWNTYATNGLASPVVGSIFQASGAGTGTGTVTPLVLATALSAGVTYQIASMGTTTPAQWIAVGASGYVAVGTTFKATGAAVGTGLCVAMTSGAGIALVVTNGAAGANNLSFSCEITES
jgi:hypothetical protein